MTVTVPVRHQFGAIPVIDGDDGLTRVILITTRDSKRWSIPKGNLMKGKKPHRVAEIEAFEEAGILGDADKTPLGSYDFLKRIDGGFVLARVDVYLLKVTEVLDDWPERKLRDVRAFLPHEAADVVNETGLVDMLRSLAPVELVP